MKIIFALLLNFVICNSSLANEINKDELITLPIESSEIDTFHEDHISETLQSFFSTYGKSEKIGGHGISIFYYKSKNNQTIMVGTADFKTILYVQLME